VTLSLLGGVTGIAIGVGASLLISYLAKWSTLVSPTAIMLAFRILRAGRHLLRVLSSTQGGAARPHRRAPFMSEARARRGLANGGVWV